MTKRQFVVLAFRLFALYLLFSLISPLVFFTIHLIENLSNGGHFDELYIEAVLSLALELVLIVFLWIKGDWLMKRIFATPALTDTAASVEKNTGMTAQIEADSEEVCATSKIKNNFNYPISKGTIELIAFSAIGLWVAFNQVPKLLQDSSLVRTITTGNGNPFSAMFAREFERSKSLEDIIQFALGIWLFLRPWQFQGWIEKFKPKEELSEDETPTKLSS
jgi:hypothetical protein